MKHLKLFEGFEDIDAICQKYGITNYTINSDGSIDVNSVFLYDRGLHELPLKFNKVSGYFNCANNQLESLEGAPKWVGGNFNCANNLLTSLVGSPKWVGGSFDCDNNKLVTLEGAPKRVGTNFYCSNNQLTTLEGAPKSVGTYFNCDKNPLPQLIYDNYQYIEEIIKWQDEYNIWRNGNLDEFRFEEMMIDIKEELKK